MKTIFLAFNDILTNQIYLYIRKDVNSENVLFAKYIIIDRS
jgi:hypothetical protein